MARIGTINITQTSQNVVNNTTTFLVECIITTTGESYRGDHRTGTVTVYSGSTAIHSKSFTHGAPANSRTVLYSVTLTVSHNSNGVSPTISANYNYDSGWATGTATKTFATIPRQSSLSVGNGTLGVEQTLTVSRKSTSFTHTIVAKCGNSSETICSKSTSDSVLFTPPMSWASNNTTGTSLSVTYTITTYSGTTNIGSTNYTKTLSIPSSVKPSVSISVKEVSDLQWGVYIQSKSKVKVDLTATTSYDSPIASYSTTIDGTTYTSASFTTGFLKSSGTLTISVKVTDKRGRSATATQTIDVQAYGPPKITLLKVNRCNEDGTENMQGEYCKVTVSGTANALYDRYGVSNNTLSFRVESKKSSESTYTSHGFIGYGGIKGENTGELYKVIPTASNSSYNVRITAMDVFSEASQVTVLSSGFSLMHWLASGLGMAIGKIAELTNVLDIGFQTRFMGGILQPVLEGGTDFDTLFTPNTYTLKNAIDAGYVNCPLSSGTGVLIVETCGEVGQTRHTITSCSKTCPMTYRRYYYQNAWGDWIVEPIIRCGSVVRTISADDKSLVLFTSDQIASLFGHTYAGDYKYSCSVTSGDGTSNTARVEGTTFKDNTLYILYNNAATGYIRINYVLYYYP